MPNDEMVEFWNTRGGALWVAEQDRFDGFLAPVTGRLFGAAALAPGERVLDVGCGNGATTIEAARSVGPTGTATGIDVSAPMLATARTRASAAGVPATFVEADAQTADLEGPFDVIISRFGVMFFDDPVAAFTNLAGALRPGGRMAFTCWQDLFSNEWFAVPAAAIVAHVGAPQLPEPGTPGPFAFADASRVSELLAASGLAEVVIEGASERLVLGSDAADVVAFLARDEMGRRMLEGRDPETIEAALAASRDAMAAFETPDGVRLNAAYWVVTARRG